MKKNKIKCIHIVLENCEVFEVPPKSIDYLTLKNINKSIGVNYYQYENGEIYETIKPEEVILAVKNFDKIKNITGWPDPEPFLDRMNMHKDITHLDLIYEDGGNEYYCVPWGDSEYTNDYQVHKQKKNYKRETVLEITIKEQ